LLYVQDGKLITSAGTAAGIDACLHLVRREHGSAVATKLARRMVVPPHRHGGQAQYVEMPISRTPDAPTLEPLLGWLLGHLDQATTVEDLAARAHMAPCTFARRFRAETGTTPHDWLTNQRVLLARRLLEETELGVEAVAVRSGLILRRTSGDSRPRIALEARCGAVGAGIRAGHVTALRQPPDRLPVPEDRRLGRDGQLVAPTP
jgi:transcriptional regulator GlxA family with amidase domain